MRNLIPCGSTKMYLHVELEFPSMDTLCLHIVLFIRNKFKDVHYSKRDQINDKQ